MKPADPHPLQIHALEHDADRDALAVEESGDAISATTVGYYLEVATVRDHLVIDDVLELLNQWTICANWRNRG